MQRLPYREVYFFIVVVVASDLRRRQTRGLLVKVRTIIGTLNDVCVIVMVINLLWYLLLVTQ